MRLKDQTLVNYVLVFTNNKGELALAKSDGTQAQLEDKPFYKREQNAEDAKKKIVRSIKNSNFTREYWYDKIKAEGTEKEPGRKRMIDDYENGMLILENGLEVKRILIKVDI